MEAHTLTHREGQRLSVGVREAGRGWEEQLTHLLCPPSLPPSLPAYDAVQTPQYIPFPSRGTLKSTWTQGLHVRLELGRAIAHTAPSMTRWSQLRVADMIGADSTHQGYVDHVDHHTVLYASHRQNARLRGTTIASLERTPYAPTFTTENVPVW